MKLTSTWLLMMLLASAAQATLQLVPSDKPAAVFAGEARSIDVTFSNASDTPFEAEIRIRIFQTSSATVVPISDAAWKKLQVLRSQTVLESVRLDFPAVKAETKFLVQWLENTNRVIGKTEVLVYPTNLLAELKPLAGDAALGIFDPQNQIKPLLKNLKVEFNDLENSGLENFSGKLAIVGPFPSKAKMREGLAEPIQALAKKGATIVWIQPPRERGEKLTPSFYSVLGNASGTNSVVIIQPDLVANLADNPQAQLNLIYFCKLALQPETFHLPSLNRNHD